MVDNLAQNGDEILEPGHSLSWFTVGVIRVPGLEQGREWSCVATAGQKEIAAALL